MNDPERRVPRYDRDVLDKDKDTSWMAADHDKKERREQINHPHHYGGDTTYETIKVLEAWLSPEQFQGFLIGNAMKYQSRYRHKGGVEDLKKAKWYLDKYLEKFGDQ